MIVTRAPNPRAILAALVPTTPPPRMTTSPGGTPGTPASSTPRPPWGCSRKRAPTWTDMRPAITSRPPQPRTAAAPSPQGLAAARIVLAERVQAALASGQPFAADVAALAKGGGSPDQLAALNAVATTGAATKDALLTQLRGHRAMFVRELTPVSAGWQDRALALVSRVISIRPVGDTGANDPATLPARLEAAIARGDIVAAAAAWEQLPEPARRESAAFGEALRKRASADAAIAKITQDAVAALGAAG